MYTSFGDYMKKLLKKVFTPIFLSVICGGICGQLIYQIYDSNIEKDIYGKKIYLIQAGAYQDYENMIKNTSFNHYVYYEDEDGVYKSIIGLTENQNNIDKIKKAYNNEVVVTEYYSKDDVLNKQIEEYDKKIMQTDNQEEIKKQTLEMLKLYKNKEQSTLTKVT